MWTAERTPLHRAQPAKQHMPHMSHVQNFSCTTHACCIVKYKQAITAIMQGDGIPAMLVPARRQHVVLVLPGQIYLYEQPSCTPHR